MPMHGYTHRRATQWLVLFVSKQPHVELLSIIFGPIITLITTNITDIEPNALVQQFITLISSVIDLSFTPE